MEVRWAGYDLVGRTRAAVLRYRLVLPGGEVVEVRQSPELISGGWREAWTLGAISRGQSVVLRREGLSPGVRAIINPWHAEAGKWLHPMRTSRYLLGEAFNPWMCGIAILAGAIRQERHPLPDDDPLLEWERTLLAATTTTIEAVRHLRDRFLEGVFTAGYGTGTDAPGTPRET